MHADWRRHAIHFHLETFLLVVRTDRAHTTETLLEVGIDRAAANAVQALELP